MQVCHGKVGPLRRLKAGDGVVYYSPVIAFGGSERCQAFTAFGTVADDAVYQADMGEGFRPWRRAVAWREAAPVPIHPLLDRLDLTRGRRAWGYPFRFGLLEATGHDMGLILAAAGVCMPGLDLVGTGP